MAGLTSEQGRTLLLGKFSDLTLVCKEVQFKVHKSIVCVASPVIDKLCSARPEESYFQVPDPAITPLALARLLQQIYTPTAPETNVPLLLQSNENSRLESVLPQPRPANTPQPSNLLPDAQDLTPAAMKSDLGAVGASSHGSNTGIGRSQATNAPQAKVGDATPTQPFPNFAIPETDSVAVKARNAFEVYICAKALQIDHVMMTAQRRVLTRVWAIFSGANSLTSFADVLAFIFESTKSGQDKLREQITSICLEKHHQCSSNAAVAAVIEEYEGTLWRVAVPLLRKSAADRDASIAAAQPTSPGLFGSVGSKSSTGGLFGNGVSGTFGGGLFHSSNGVTSSGGSEAFSFGTSAYTKPAAGLFGRGTPAVKDP